MKKTFPLLALCIICFTKFLNAQGHFKIRNDEFIQIGYNAYKVLSFGKHLGTPNNGIYSMEYISGGLNIFKPWPAPNYGNYVFFLRDDRNIGVNTSGSSSFRMDINGSLRVASLHYYSDIDLKTNIQPIPTALSLIRQLKGVTYTISKEQEINLSAPLDSLTETKIQTNQASIEAEKEFRAGLVAQEVEKIIPHIVKQDENGIRSINYIDLIPYLIEALKEQNVEIESLRNEINLLKSK